MAVQGVTFAKMGVGGLSGSTRPPNGVTLAKVLEVKWGYHAGPPYRQGKSNLVSDGRVIFSFLCPTTPQVTLRKRVKECGISPRG